MHPAVRSYPRADSPLTWLQLPPEIPGVIRTTPSDFKVDEQLGFVPGGEGEHCYVRVRKTGANTRWVAWQIAEFLGLRDMDVGYAGRKDRHSVSTQWFSCYLPGRADPDWSDLTIEGVEVLEFTRHAAKLRPGELAGNRFELLVRLQDQPENLRSDVEQRLTTIEQQGFPNYFGEQRFGRDAGNLAAADRLLRLKERIRGDRSMVISAARSALFNDYLSSCVASADSLMDEGPLYGRSRDPQPGEEQLDETAAAWVAGLRRLKAKADTRPLLARPTELSWSWQDEGLRVSFGLGPGSYATSLLREVFQIEDAADKRDAGDA